MFVTTDPRKKSMDSKREAHEWSTERAEKRSEGQFVEHNKVSSSPISRFLSLMYSRLVSKRSPAKTRHGLEPTAEPAD